MASTATPPPPPMEFPSSVHLIYSRRGGAKECSQDKGVAPEARF